MLHYGNTTVTEWKYKCYRMEIYLLQDGHIPVTGWKYNCGETTKTKYIIYGYFYIFFIFQNY